MQSSPSIIYRALVTYSNERTGEIRVKIPSVIGNSSDVSVSFISRFKTNSIWVVPTAGEQIVVSADDENMTNIFWLHTDGMHHTKHYRNYFEALSTETQHVVETLPGVSDTMNATYNTVVFSEGIRLVDGSKITFDYEGIYNFQYSVQWMNTDSQAHDTAVWVAYNDSPYPNSSTYTSVPAKHGSVNGTAVTAINIIGHGYPNDYIELHWAANNSAITMQTLTPYTGFPSTTPVSPSVIVTVTQVA